MLVSILKSKLHRARVTDANVNYMGSISIDRDLMDSARLNPYEKVLVVSLDSGQRLETYVIEEKGGSGEICINGAAARKILKGDTVIIMAFTLLDEKELSDFKPKIVYLDERNRILREDDHAAGDDQC
ncbi:MAG: aspartate 1-decarboxylase [Actinobacteria bacterium]|nr:aspartate 1-decarboxylase [Actinomycetota bacterium]